MNEVNILYRHLCSVIETIYNQFNINDIQYQVYDTELDVIPPFINSNHKFVCLIKFKSEVDIIDIQSRLTKFLGKSVQIFESSDTSYFYWFEGEEIDINILPVQITINNLESKTAEISKVKTNTRLPKWLDNRIFTHLNATYSPDFEKFEYNLNLDESELKNYLGTYFPRSYAETACTVDDLLSNSVCKSAICNKTTFNILDVGCGSGGNLIGLLVALLKNCEKASKFIIYAIDGNSGALDIYKDILTCFSQQYRKEVEVQVFEKKIERINDLQQYINSFNKGKFDWIVASKFIGEIIASGNGLNDNAYFEITELCCPLLVETGLLIIVDVTIKLNHASYLPLLLNRQLRDYTKANSDFSIISPISCNQYASICNQECFSQQTFTINHSHKINDFSKIVYKIIGHTKFAVSIVQNLKKGKFVISWKVVNNEQVSEKYCPHSDMETELIDSYKLS